MSKVNINTNFPPIMRNLSRHTITVLGLMFDIGQSIVKDEDTVTTVGLTEVQDGNPKEVFLINYTSGNHIVCDPSLLDRMSNQQLADLMREQYLTGKARQEEMQKSLQIYWGDEEPE